MELCGRIRTLKLAEWTGIAILQKQDMFRHGPSCFLMGSYAKAWVCALACAVFQGTQHSLAIAWLHFGDIPGRCLAAIRERHLQLPDRHSGLSLTAAWSAFGSVRCCCLAAIRGVICNCLAASCLSTYRWMYCLLRRCVVTACCSRVSCSLAASACACTVVASSLSCI